MDYTQIIIAAIQVFGTIVIALLAYLTRRDVAELTVNTNSIKDALVKVTGDSEFAKGVIEGKRQSTPNSH